MTQAHLKLVELVKPWLIHEEKNCKKESNFVIFFCANWCGERDKKRDFFLGLLMVCEREQRRKGVFFLFYKWGLTKNKEGKWEKHTLGEENLQKLQRSLPRMTSGLILQVVISKGLLKENKYERLDQRELSRK